MKFAVFVTIFMVVVVARPSAAQSGGPTAMQTVKWQTLNSKDEFSITMPEASKGYTEDKEYFVGRNRNRVTKRVFVYRNINRAALIVEMLEGDVRGVKEELVARIDQGPTPYKLVKGQSFDGVSVDLYERRQDKLFSTQQFILFKKALYVVQAHAGDETNPVLQQFFRSLGLVAGGKSVMPNLRAGDDPKLATKPPDIAVAAGASSSGDEPLIGKPDRDAIILYKPRPRYTPEARTAGASGQVDLKVLFGASGSIKKIEVESGEMALRQSAVAAAEQIIFLPAEKDGQPVSVWKKLSYSFAIY